MSASNKDIRRQISGMPTGRNTLADKTFTVTHHKPAPELKFPELLEGFALFMPAPAPFQELEDAVNRWIKREGR